MKTFHPLSFVLGLGSGALILFVVFASLHMIGGRPQRGFAAGGAGNFQRQGGGFNRAAMAQRMGMTEADLQAELDAGKTMQQIAAEHGVQFQGGRNRGSGSGTSVSAASTSSASSAQ